MTYKTLQNLHWGSIFLMLAGFLLLASFLNGTPYSPQHLKIFVGGTVIVLAINALVFIYSCLAIGYMHMKHWLKLYHRKSI